MSATRAAAAWCTTVSDRPSVLCMARIDEKGIPVEYRLPHVGTPGHATSQQLRIVDHLSRMADVPLLFSEVKYMGGVTTESPAVDYSLYDFRDSILCTLHHTRRFSVDGVHLKGYYKKNVYLRWVPLSELDGKLGPHQKLVDYLRNVK